VLTYYEPVQTEQHIQIESRETIPAYDTTGKRIDAATLARQLKKETPVLIAMDGKMVNPYHLQVVKEDTVIFVPSGPLTYVPPLAQPGAAVSPGGKPEPPSISRVLQPLTPVKRP
jgi:hypothetical protein